MSNSQEKRLMRNTHTYIPTNIYLTQIPHIYLHTHTGGRRTVSIAILVEQGEGLLEFSDLLFGQLVNHVEKCDVLKRKISLLRCVWCVVGVQKTGAQTNRVHLITMHLEVHSFGFSCYRCMHPSENQTLFKYGRNSRVF
jgi:hypothetical protein